MRRHLLAALLLGAATIIAPATTASAAVPRVCVTFGSAAASQVFAYYTFGTSILRPGQCSSSTTKPYQFQIGGIPCYSQWGGFYPMHSVHGTSLLRGDLNLTCR